MISYDRVNPRELIIIGVEFVTCMVSASYLGFIVMNAVCMCVLMDQGKISIEFYSVIINACSLESKIRK